jgi:hypothetical protein
MCLMLCLYIHVRVLIHIIVLMFTIISCCLSVTPSQPLYYRKWHFNVHVSRSGWSDVSGLKQKSLYIGLCTIFIKWNQPIHIITTVSYLYNKLVNLIGKKKYFNKLYTTIVVYNKISKNGNRWEIIWNDKKGCPFFILKQNWDF